MQGGGFVIGGTVIDRALTLLEQPGPVDLEGRATSEAPRASGFLIPTPLAVAVTLGHPEIS